MVDRVDGAGRRGADPDGGNPDVGLRGDGPRRARNNHHDHPDGTAGHPARARVRCRRGGQGRAASPGGATHEDRNGPRVGCARTDRDGARRNGPGRDGPGRDGPGGDGAPGHERAHHGGAHPAAHHHRSTQVARVHGVEVLTLAAISSQTWWWLARATGIVAWLVITAGVVWGLLLSSRLVRRRGVPAWLLDLHRYLGTLALVFTGAHLAFLVADSYVYFGPRELLVPMASTWRPGAVTWGVLAAYVLALVQLTSWLMKRLPRRLWHAVHLSSFVLFALATVHGALAGADRANRLVQSAALIGVTLVLSLLAFRLAGGRTAVADPSAEPMLDRTAVPAAVGADDPAAAARAERLAALAARGRAGRSSSRAPHPERV